MCINPVHHEGKIFACRNCWQCDENRIQDWVGRCIAETKTSTRALYGTLTYGGGDHERATVLTYSDVQKSLKRLRRDGFKFKYLVSGEFGGRKGRTHWHILLFFRGPAPVVELRTEYYTWKYWDHGYSYWDDVNPKSARYVCKYIRKDAADEESQAHFAMSKKPPIGSEYFYNRAKWHVENGVAPQDLIYTFDENRDKHGKKVKHYMHGATARDFCQAYIDLGGRYLGEPGWGYSTLIAEFADGLVNDAPDPYMRTQQRMERPAWVPRKGAPLNWSERLHSFTTTVDGHTYYWRQSEGQYTWQSADGATRIAFQQSDHHRRLERIGQWRARKARAAMNPTASPLHGEPDSVVRLHLERDRQRQAKRLPSLPLTGEPIYRGPRPNRVPHQKEQQ